MKKLWALLAGFGLLTGFGLLPQGGLLAQRPPPEPTPQWRPVYHFTPEKNWTNDPNGLIYLDGVYHLYNQQNPFENKWGHMSWGHATSTDLIHWRHWPIAIPETIDQDTTWRFSGCVVRDKDNTSGFCKGGGGCLVAIYTADQPNRKRESQYIAYSNDSGMTYTNYAGNPVIDLQKKNFRDPNVGWNAELGKWVMVVALPAEHKVRFYASANLKQWDLLSEFGPAGYIGAAWECPSLISLPAEGRPQEKKWVLLVSAAGGERRVFMQYFVGGFAGGKFTNDNPADTVLTVDEGDCFYAAIPWNDAPGDRKILIGWMIPGATQTYPWRGQMSIPRDLSLRATGRGLRLVQQPTAVIRQGAAMTKTGAPVKDLSEIRSNSYWLSAELVAPPGGKAALKLANEAEVEYDAGMHQVYVRKGKAGAGGAATETGTGAVATGAVVTQTIDWPWGGDTVRLELLVDNSSLEVFVNGGQKVLTTYFYPDKGTAGIRLESGMLNHLKLWDLSIIKQ